MKRCRRNLYKNKHECRIEAYLQENSFNLSFNQHNQRKKLTTYNNDSVKTKEHLSMVVRKNVGIAGTVSTYVDHPLEQVFDGCHRIASVS